jgi:PAS domain S-box-containing protein/diguanylate cyclase (GGDEF)-like protein
MGEDKPSGRQRRPAKARPPGEAELRRIDDTLDLYLEDLKSAATGFDRVAGSSAKALVRRKQAKALSDKLAGNVLQLQRVMSRLSALVEVGMEMTKERDPARLVEIFFAAACEIVDSRIAAIVILDEKELAPAHVFAKGVEPRLFDEPGSVRHGLLETTLEQRRALRMDSIDTDLGADSLPAGHPLVRNFLGVAIATESRTLGLLYFADKLEARNFDPEDERLAAIMAAKLALLYENLQLFDVVQRHAATLQLEAAERRRAQDSLRESEAGLHRAQLMAKLAHVITGPEGAFLSWSETLPQLLGVEFAHMPKNTREWLELIHPDDRAGFRAKAIEGDRTALRVEFEYRLARADSTWMHLKQVSEPLTDAPDASGGMRWFGTLRDVTQEVQAAETLRASEERHRAMFEQAAVGIVHTSLEGMVRLANPKTCEMTGYTHAEIVQLSINDLTHPDDIQESVDSRSRRLMDSEEAYERELRVLRKDRSEIWVHLTTSLIRDANGQPSYFISVLDDISERKRVQIALQHSEGRFRALTEHSSDLVLVHDRQGVMRYVSPSVEPMSGFAADEVTGRRLQEFIHPDDVAPLMKEMDVIFTNPDRVYASEFRYRHKNGQWIVLAAISKNALDDPAVQGIVVNARDITDRKLAETRVKRLNRVNAVLSGINGAIVRIRDRQELFDEVCRIAVETGGLPFAWLGEVDEVEKRLRVVASAGGDPAFLTTIGDRLSLKDDAPAGHGIGARSVREKRVLAMNDVSADAYAKYRASYLERGMKSVAALPLLIAGRAVGTFALHAAETGFFDEDEMKLLGEVAGNIAFALEHIEKEENVQRLTRVYAVLSGINELIIRVRGRDELFRGACRIAVEQAGFPLVWIGMFDAASQDLKLVAMAGTVPEYAKLLNPSVRADIPAGQGTNGRAFREKKPIVDNDMAMNPNVGFMRREGFKHGVRAALSLPLLLEGVSIGVIAFYAKEKDYFDEEEVKLLSQLASDITFAIDHIDKQGRLARLSRIEAVMSNINSLIVRVRDRDELFRETCRIAVQLGQFPLAWVALADQRDQRVNAVAWAGDERGFVQLGRPTVDAAGQRKAGLSAQAIESLKPTICNDIEADGGGAMQYPQEALVRGYRSAVALPLVIEGKAFGALVLYATETGFFNDEEMKLLRELAGDISFALDHIEKKEKLDYLAYYDQLTGLANRTLFHERLAQHVHAAQSSNGKLAVVVADIERFRMINDSLGRQAGDELLKQIAGRLALAAGQAEVARAGSDHFAIVLPEMAGRSEIGRTVEEIWRKCLNEPFKLNDTDIRVSMRGGIAVFPSDGTSADSLFRNAEAAWKKAKQSGERYLFHAPEMTARIAENLALENKLRQAVEREEFVLHYQPKVDLATRRVAGVEALIRWNSPERGLVPPGLFIPLLEQTGLILQVGAWALGRAVLDHAHLQSQGVTAPRIAVNVSAIQLRQRDFVDVVKEAIAGGPYPTAIDVEITESLLMEDVAGNIKKLAALRDMGMKISIDDFGTGYSSLGYLAKLPVHTLKIDRSFIITMLNEPDTMTLVSTIISLAHSLKLTVVAEGVEQEEQARMLRLLRCDQMQGYLFSKPVPMEQLITLLRAGKEEPVPT